MTTADDFKRLAKHEKDSRLKTRYLALYHFRLGVSRTQIATYLGVARGSVNTWVSDFLADGIDGLKSKKSPGRPCGLSRSELNKLSAFVHDNAIKPDGGRLMAEDVRRYIAEHLQVNYSLANVYRLLHSMGFSWITSRSKHPKQSQEVQKTFKKLPHGNDPSHPI